MIKIEFEEPTTQAWIDWLADCAAEQALLDAAVANGDNTKAKSSLYGRLKKDVYTNRRGAFRGKCAFCEERIRTNQHGDVEHFRPKAAVRNENNQAIQLADGSRPHPGYYWLTYNWRNLLPSCALCNQPSTEPEGESIGKRNYFPLVDEAARAQAANEEVNEQPLLINPVFEDPASHLGVDSSGVIFAHNNSTRGATCIRVFGLNMRELPTERKRVYDDVQNLYKRCVAALMDDPTSQQTQELRARIERIETGDEEFTAAARQAIVDVKNNLRAMLGPL